MVCLMFRNTDSSVQLGLVQVLDVKISSIMVMIAY